MNLLDRLKAWHSTPGSPGNAELKEMAQIGLRIITGYIKQQRSPVSFTQTIYPQTINIKYYSLPLTQISVMGLSTESI